MGLWNAIDVSASGLRATSTWLGVLSHNVANVNSVRPSDEEPFRSLLIRLAPQQGSSVSGLSNRHPGGGAVDVGGVRVAGIDESGAEAAIVYDPTHPYADEDGNVVMPVVDLASQMTDLIIASRQYTLNTRVLQTSREAYQSALRIGRS